MLTVHGEPEKVMSVVSGGDIKPEVEKSRPTFSWKGHIFNVPLADANGMVPLGEIIPVLFLLMTTDSKEERNEIMKAAMLELKDANGARYFPA